MTAAAVRPGQAARAGVKCPGHAMVNRCLTATGLSRQFKVSFRRDSPPRRSVYSQAKVSGIGRVGQS